MPVLTTVAVMFGVGSATSLLFPKNKKTSTVKGLRVLNTSKKPLVEQVRAVVSEKDKSLQTTKAPDDAETELARALPLAALGAGSGLAALFNPFFTIPAVVISGYLTVPLLRDGIRKFREHRHIVDLLDSAIIPTLIALHSVLAATLLLLSTSISRRVLAKTYDSSKQNLHDMLSGLPKRVWLLKDDVEIEIDYREVKAGDVVIANTGEAIPVDGIVVRGEALIDQTMLTGESVPAEKTVDDIVFASTLVVSGRIFVQVEKAGEQTHASEVSALILQAADRRMAVQERGEKIAESSLRPLLGLSAITALFGSLSRALNVYLVTPGYTMRLLAPLALLRTLHHAADEGVLVKDGRSLELLQNIDTIVFDKTGTLTDGSLAVAEIIPNDADKFDRHTILKFAAAAESSQTHPIARAIMAAAEAENIVPTLLDDTEYVVGRGIKVQIDGHKVMLGSLSFMADQGLSLSANLSARADHISQNGFSLIFIAIDEDIAGLIALDQMVRPEAKQAIADLRQRGLKTVIISGDAQAATQHMASQLGIDDFYAETLPGDKANLIKDMQDKGRHVCFIGDGINDAAALKQADVSMSIRGSSTIAVDTAQIVLVNANLSLIGKLLAIAENYEGMANFTTRLAVGLPLLALPAVLFGVGGTILVVAAHNTSTWVGLWRILRINEKNSKHFLTYGGKALNSPTAK